METISPGKHVSIVYDLYTIADDGTEQLVHQSDPADPEQFIFGVTRGVIEPLGKALEGLHKGDPFNVTVPSDEAFGRHNPDQIVTLDKEMFKVDGKFDSGIVAVGKYVPMLTAEGFRVNGLVKEITDDKVTMDFNHPLAGKTIRFDGKVQEVRQATDEEIHIATSGGCGCGCNNEECSGGSCGCSDGGTCGCGSCH